MSRSATEELVKARKMFKIPIVGETLAAGLARNGNECRHSCFQHAAGHLLSPPLRSDPTTPAYLMKALAVYVTVTRVIIILLKQIVTGTIFN